MSGEQGTRGNRARESTCGHGGRDTDTSDRHRGSRETRARERQQKTDIKKRATRDEKNSQQQAGLSSRAFLFSRVREVHESSASQRDTSTPGKNVSCAHERCSASHTSARHARASSSSRSLRPRERARVCPATRLLDDGRNSAPRGPRRGHSRGARGVPVRPGHRRGASPRPRSRRTRPPTREERPRTAQRSRRTPRTSAAAAGAPAPGRLLVLAERAGDARRRAGDAVAERDELVAEDQLVQGGRRGRRARAGGPHRRGLGPRGSRTLPPRATDVPQPVHRAGPEGPCARRRRAAFRCATRPWRTPGAVRRSQRARARLGWRRVRARGGAMVHSRLSIQPRSRPRPMAGSATGARAPPEEMRGARRPPASRASAASAGARSARARWRRRRRGQVRLRLRQGRLGGQRHAAVVIARDARDAAAGAAADASRPASETASETDERALGAENREASPRDARASSRRRAARAWTASRGVRDALAAAGAGARTRRASPRRRSGARRRAGASV